MFSKLIEALAYHNNPCLPNKISLSLAYHNNPKLTQDFFLPYHNNPRSFPVWCPRGLVLLSFVNEALTHHSEACVSYKFTCWQLFECVHIEMHHLGIVFASLCTSLPLGECKLCIWAKTKVRVNIEIIFNQLIIWSFFDNITIFVRTGLIYQKQNTW